MRPFCCRHRFTGEGCCTAVGVVDELPLVGANWDDLTFASLVRDGVGCIRQEANWDKVRFAEQPGDVRVGRPIVNLARCSDLFRCTFPQ